MKKENMFKNTETAQQISDIILVNDEFCKMYSISSANMNVHVDKKVDDLTKTNRITEISEDIELAKQIISSMNLDSKHFNAVKRIQVWVDSDAIVLFVGAVYAVHATLAQQTAEQHELFTQLFEDSVDKKYYENSKIDISEKTESRHVFKSIETFETFFNLLSQLTVSRKKALADSTAQQTAKETAQQTDSKKEQKKTKRQRKTKKADISVVSADEIAQLTKEVIEADAKNA